MATLTWNQVNAWRLGQHHLLEPTTPANMLDVVERLGGAHAQMMSAAELSLAARIHDLSPTAVQTALWEDRTLVKSWFMRGTLHLVTARSFPTYVGALRTFKHYQSGSWLKYFGLKLAEMDDLLVAMQAVLHDSGLTREQLADAIADKLNKPHLREKMLGGWGSMLKPASFRGDLCYGPNAGKHITFVRPSAWMGEWQPVESEAAFAEAVRWFLNAYAPAQAANFARYIGMYVTPGKKVFHALDDELETVNIEGYEAHILASTRSAIESAQMPDCSVRLLPHFDPYTVVLAPQHEFLMPPEHKKRVYRNQGWISPVVLVNGRMVGVWEQKKKSKRIIVNVDLFAPQPKKVKTGIEAEAQRLGRFLDTEIELAYI